MSSLARSKGIEVLRMTEGSDGSVVEQAAVQVALTDVNHFLKYLRRAVPICLEEDAVSSPAFEAALSEKNHQEAIKKFISDPQSRAIFIQRSSTKGKGTTNENS